MEKFIEAASPVCEELKKHLLNLKKEVKERVTEIRLRAEKPLELTTDGGSLFLLKDGGVTTNFSALTILCTSKNIEETFLRLCEYSVYSFEKEISNGFITIKGGHRVGFCGTANYKDGRIISVKNISSINIRVARQIEEASGGIIDLYEKEGFGSTLIFGVPASGKTTLLKDISKKLASGNLKRPPKKLCVIDERGELGAVSDGAANNNLGILSDVLDGYQKEDGINIATRTLSPQVIICDELGGDKDIKAAETAALSGIDIIASIHAKTPGDIFIKNKNLYSVFAYFIGIELVNKQRKITVYRKDENKDEDYPLRSLGSHLLPDR